MPMRRNDGSLDLYSDGKMSGGKYSQDDNSNNSEDDEDNSAAKDLQQYVKNLEGRKV